MNIDAKELSQFLVKAKVNTYASDTKATILRDGSKELVFSEGRLFYRDRYLGESFFIGQELVFHQDEHLWGMNYYGCAIPTKDFSLRDLYTFLRKALKRVDVKSPFRGPEKYEERFFKYANSVKGDISQFNGAETIFYKEVEVYRLLYHGGFISNET
jgi:hypothetical protein